MSIFHKPTLGEQLGDTWKKHKGELLSIGGGLATVGIASRVANIIHDKRVHAEQKQRDDAAMEIQRSTLQNQIVSTRILDNLVKKLTQTP